MVTSPKRSVRTSRQRTATSSAEGKATVFFDSVRAEAGRPDQGDARQMLEDIAAERDPLTVALTQNDPAALEMLRAARARLRQALGENTPRVETGTNPTQTAPPPG